MIVREKMGSNQSQLKKEDLDDLQRETHCMYPLFSPFLRDEFCVVVENLIRIDIFFTLKTFTH